MAWDGIVESTSQTRERICRLLESVKDSCGNSVDNLGSLHGVITKAGYAYAGPKDDGAGRYILQGRRGARLLTADVYRETLFGEAERVLEGRKDIAVLKIEASNYFGHVPLNDIGAWINHLVDLAELDAIREKEEGTRKNNSAA